ncbi:SDR family oxidoreductase [Nocardia puris]|uniref:SDR family oxidoreductase n=1 Tax=Nocardia puris TaxID=208602 RepID=UPI001893C71D|nr:SDR family oxidoreductase [Nocardia puris]MBF6211249.1 SDR family oxidoreductase [Nocardia puris]MBF6364968.1 SDR family oxidoreductase [Nocardia puris]MBF6458754.1 SDR family oxidoreductase [Nocardia puris]
MTVAVTGASGQLGRLVVEELLRAGVTPVAIVRDPDKVAGLAERGVDVRRADYSDAEALDRALAGVDRLLLISGNEFGERITQHTNVIRAAERAGLDLLAYTSIPRATESPLVLAQEHRGTEAVLAESTVPHVLLRNGWYWENYLGGLAHAVESGVLSGAAGTGTVAAATRADYAAAAARVLTTDGHAGQVYELGGDRLTYSELAQVISEASGKPVRYENLSEADYAAALVQAGLPEPYAKVLADADAGVAGGWLDVTSGDLEKLIGRAPTPPVEVFRAALA